MVIEVQKQHSDMEEEGAVPEVKPESNPLRSQLLEIYRDSGEMRVMIDWPHVQWFLIIMTLQEHCSSFPYNFFSEILDTNVGVSFTLLPRFQYFVILEYVEVCFN